jgi:hypothetical protein
VVFYGVDIAVSGTVSYCTSLNVHQFESSFRCITNKNISIYSSLGANGDDDGCDDIDINEYDSFE